MSFDKVNTISDLTVSVQIRSNDADLKVLLEISEVILTSLRIHMRERCEIGVAHREMNIKEKFDKKLTTVSLEIENL